MNADRQRAVDFFVASICERDCFLAELGDGWRRNYGRLDPAAPVFATLVYEHAERDPVRVDLEFDAGAGWRRRIARFQDDPELVGAARALSRLNEPRVVRYRPGKRCVIRGVDPASSRRIFAKTFADARGDDLWRDARLLFAAAADERFGFRVAEPAWFDDAAQTIAHFEAAGAPISSRLASSEGLRLAAALGSALATIPASGVAAPARLGATEQLARTRKYLTRLERAAPALAQLSAQLGRRFKKAHSAARQGPALPIHGAPHPQQWLHDETGFALVDFDRFSLGPPELDAATFAAELDFEPIEAAFRNKLIRSFVSSFEAGVSGFDRATFALYRAHKHAAKAVKTAFAIRSDRILRAEAILESALEIIDREVL